MTITTTSSVSSFFFVPTKPSLKFQASVNYSKQEVIYITKQKTFSISYTRPPSVKLIPFLRFASASSSTPAVEEEEDQEKTDEPPSCDNDGVLLKPESSTFQQDHQTTSSMRGCQACGKEEIERGCNGEGRIQGGIATVPGFGWWPIKAYRPCPSYVATGGRYRRTGQSMDDIGFGGGGRETSAGNDEKAKSSKKQQGARKYKS